MSLSRLLWRQFAASPTGLLLLALLVAAMTGFLVAGPRSAADLSDAQLAHRLGELSAQQGDVASSWRSMVASSTIDGYQNPWEPYAAAAEAIHQAQPEPLRSILRPAQFGAKTSQVFSFTPPARTGYFQVTLEAEIDPQLPEHAELVAGEWPRPARLGADDGIERVEVTILEDVARALSWEVGQQIPAGPTVTGIHRPIDVGDSRWEHIPAGVGYAELVNADRGVELLGSVFLSPRSIGNYSPGVAESVQLDLWFGLDLGLAAAVDVALLRTQLTGMLARQYQVPSPQPSGEAGVVAIDLHSDLSVALDDVAAQQRTSNTLFLVMAAGPFAIGLVLIGLAARFVTHRRRPALLLAHARGASLPQLRLMAAVEGLALTLPAAILGHGAGSLLVAGPSAWWEPIPTLLVAGFAPLALALGAGSILKGGTRTAPGHSRNRSRLAAEILLLAVVAAALWRLLSTRNPSTPTTAVGFDILGLGAPILVAVAGCALALRLYPWPLRALLGLLRSGRGLVGFLGTARALRTPAGGSAPVFAVVLGTTVAVLSSVLSSTVTQGMDEAAWDRNGADVNLSGPAITDELLSELRSLDGVASVSRLFDTRERRRLASAAGETAVTVWVAESSLSVVYTAAGLPSLPENFFEGHGDPVVVVGGGGPGGEPTDLAGIGRIEVGARWETLPGSPASGSWVLMDVERWRMLGGAVGLPRLALIDVAQGAEPAAVALAVHDAAGGGLVTTAQDQLSAARSQPVVANLGGVLVLISGLTLAAMAMAVVVSHGMGNRERAQVAGVLHVLGAGRRTTGAVAAWELLPVVAVALAFGVGFGIAIAILLLVSLDFTVLTGGLGAPALVVSWYSVGLVVAVVVAVTAAAVVVSSWLAGRVDLALATRSGEEA